MAVVLNKQKLFQTFIIGIYEIKTALVICPEDIQKLSIEASHGRCSTGMLWNHANAKNSTQYLT